MYQRALRRAHAPLSLCVCALVCYIRDSRVSCCVTPKQCDTAVSRAQTVRLYLKLNLEVPPVLDIGGRVNNII